jgi:hypothetical protein
MLTHNNCKRTPRDWGWEFIRRDERYKKEWAQELEALSARGFTNPLWNAITIDAACPFKVNATQHSMNLTEYDNIDTFGILARGAWKSFPRGYSDASTPSFPAVILLQ